MLFKLVELPARRAIARPRQAFFAGGLCLTTAFCVTAFASLIVQPKLESRERLAANAWNDRLPERCPRVERLFHPFDKSCLIAGSGENVALLLGDSHADVLKSVLGNELASRGQSLRLLIDHSGVYLPTSPQVAVDARRRRTSQALLDVLTPEDVIEEASNFSAQKIIFHARAHHTDARALIQLADLAREKSIEVYVILPVTNATFHVPQRLFELAQEGRPPIAVLSDVENRMDDSGLNLLLQSSAANPALHILDPWPYLCRPRCVIADSIGNPYFSDSQHLTQTGVELIRPLLSGIGQDLDGTSFRLSSQ